MACVVRDYCRNCSEGCPVFPTPQPGGIEARLRRLVSPQQAGLRPLLEDAHVVVADYIDLDPPRLNLGEVALNHTGRGSPDPLHLDLWICLIEPFCHNGSELGGKGGVEDNHPLLFGRGYQVSLSLAWKLCRCNRQHRAAPTPE